MEQTGWRTRVEEIRQEKEEEKEEEEEEEEELEEEEVRRRRGVIVILFKFVGRAIRYSAHRCWQWNQRTWPMSSRRVDCTQQPTQQQQQQQQRGRFGHAIDMGQ